MITVDDQKHSTISDAASALGVDVATIRRWLAAEILPPPPHVKYGKGNVNVFPKEYLAGARTLLEFGRSHGTKRRPPTKKRRPLRVFISYSHKDFRWLHDLRTTLRSFVREDQMDVWDDSRIRAGSDWRGEIESALSRADAAILLVSRHFVASDFIFDEELLPILRAAKRRGLRVLWIAVLAFLHEDSKLNNFQALNDPNRPINSLSTARRDKEWVEIARKIKLILSER